MYSCLEDYTSQTDTLYTSEYGKGPFVARVPILKDSRDVTSEVKGPLNGVMFLVLQTRTPLKLPMHLTSESQCLLLSHQ